MRILMLGWEFPPFISGGLGTACFGLTRALDRKGHEVLFVLPRAIDQGVKSHVKLLGPDAALAPGAPGLPVPAPARSASAPVSHTAPSTVTTTTTTTASVAAAQVSGEPQTIRERVEAFRHAVLVGLPGGFASPYGNGGPVAGQGASAASGGVRMAIPPGASPELVQAIRVEVEALRAAGVHVDAIEEFIESPMTPGAPSGRVGEYCGDLVSEAGRYAALVVRLARRERFDVVHAHDWLTYPAGMAVARATGKPLVIHVHATEFDRSGEHVNQRVYDIERRGMHAATRVVCVSEYTRRICEIRYGVAHERTRVIYNGVDVEGEQPQPELRIEAGDKIVLFLGRITMQKGPEYFVAAAKRVLEKMDNVKFIVAGAGDMATRMIEQAAAYGIGHKVLFTGFLRGRDVNRVFEMADLYVMPSVSEPFGIAPLEAMSHGTPVIISKQSGVSEVLTHALKVDFWDVDDMANKIVAVLRHPPLSSTLQEHGAMEVRRLTWDGAAEKCVRVYGEAIAEMVGV